MRSCSSCTVDGNALVPSLQDAVTSVYQTRPSATNKEVTIKLTWSDTRNSPSLCVGINNMLIVPIDGFSGSSYYRIGHSVLGLFWDFSAARYSLGPEPVSDFYVAILLDREFILLEGDRASEFAGSFGGVGSNFVAEFCMVSRIVQVVGRVIYLSRVQFYDKGEEHDVVMRFKGKEEEMSMSVCVDEEEVLVVRRLGGNFRGSEMVLVEGVEVEVEVMWDVFRWLFGDPRGCAVVMFRTREDRPDCRMLGEEKGEGIGGGFSLLIQACL